MNSKWTDSQKDFVLKNYKNYTIPELSKKLNMPAYNIRRFINYRNLEYKCVNNPFALWTKEELEFLESNYKKKMPIEQLAKHLNRNYPAVYQQIRRQGLTGNVKVGRKRKNKPLPILDREEKQTKHCRSCLYSFHENICRIKKTKLKNISFEEYQSCNYRIIIPEAIHFICTED